jgi:hypothetical protein
MPIKNKDGTPYRLTSPNPLMEEQIIWGKNYTLHGRLGQVVTFPDNAQLPARPQPPRKFSTPDEPKKEEPEIVESLEPDFVGSESEGQIQVWCLPATYKEYVDTLYNEKYRKIVYGKKFLFEAILEDQSDLFIMLWTNTKAVTEGSVLFPRTYDKRWWRVEGVKKDDEGEGYLIYATISDYHPEFSG